VWHVVIGSHKLDPVDCKDEKKMYIQHVELRNHRYGFFRSIEALQVLPLDFCLLPFDEGAYINRFKAIIRNKIKPLGLPPLPGHGLKSWDTLGLKQIKFNNRS
jgi:hypothetical protein